MYLSKTTRYAALTRFRADGNMDGCRGWGKRQGDPPDVPKWRNWQTRYIQGVVPDRAWRFESSLRHQQEFLQARDANRSRGTALLGSRRKAGKAARQRFTFVYATSVSGFNSNKDPHVRDAAMG